MELESQENFIHGKAVTLGRRMPERFHISLTFESYEITAEIPHGATEFEVAEHLRTLADGIVEAYNKRD